MSYAIHAAASFGGRMVEETFARDGRPLQIGGTGALALPVPEGRPYVARVSWTGPKQAIVLDGEGKQHLLGPDDAVVIDTGPVSLRLRLVPQLWLRRFGAVSWQLTLGWLAVVLCSTTGVMSLEAGGDVMEPYWCPVFGLFCPDPPQNADGMPGAFSADYLARLLKEDYAGADDGMLEVTKGEGKEEDSFFMPAGAVGPATEMGGAAEKAPKPIRTHGEDAGGAKIEKPAVPIVATSPEGEKIAEEEPEILKTAAESEADRTGTQGAEGEGEGPPAEEKVGFGVQDWYDAQDKKLDDSEIHQMLNAARERLKIDPEDLGALSILSYYQYLAEDFNGALVTYDKFIAIAPESSAGYNNKALVYKRRKQYEAEEALYRQALDLQPDDTTAMNNLAVNLSHQKRFDEALAIMQRLETMEPEDPYADLHRAKIYAEMGENEKAYEYLEQALERMSKLDTLHHIEFRQDIRVDPSFDRIRETPRFHAILTRYYGSDSPLQE